MKSNHSLINEGKGSVALLEELHRPLEEHWSVQSKYALDPKTSDYIYKHHITHLEDIYQNHKIIVPDPQRKTMMSPSTQLFGVKGLKSTRPVQKQVEKARETKWVSNFQKYRFLDDGLSERKRKESKDNRQKATRSSSPPPPSSSADAVEVEEDQGEGPHISRKTTNPDVSDIDLIMFGMYRLNPRQEEIYRNFVEMLSEFNEFDMESIVEDAVHDASLKGVDFTDYGGTSMEDS